MKKRKYLLPLGAIGTIITPVTMAISCSDDGVSTGSSGGGSLCRCSRI